MKYYTDLFTPRTYEAFSQSDRTLTGFRESQSSMVDRVQVGDRLLCYMTHFSRWVGVLEVTGQARHDATPRFVEADDPFVRRLPVRVLAWPVLHRTVPIHAKEVWGRLSFTRALTPKEGGWTGKVRRSLYEIAQEDGHFLEQLLQRQDGSNGADYPVDPADYERRLAVSQVRRPDRVVPVTVPNDEDAEDLNPPTPASARKSIQIQASLARLGEAMGFRIWLPANDRSRVLDEWTPNNDSLLTSLPLAYDDTTLKTIERIDVLWLKGRAIRRAFEVEHTTAIYSGLLRMADLLALQPNMSIRLHIVAPDERRDLVLAQIQRPVFSLLETAPLSDICSFVPYSAVDELASHQNLSHLRDTVLDEYCEICE